MEYQELADFLKHVGKDPSTLIFEDELTGIHNRRFLLSYLEHKVDWKDGSSFPLSLLSLDIDEFKAVNDSHGHETGDQVLKWVADLLESVAGEEGLSVRYGGDEFLVLLPGTDRDGALAVADRLLETTRDQPFRERDSGLTVPVTVSVGIAVAPEDADFPSALIQASDAALYAAKHRGRDQAALASEIGEDSLLPRAALQRLKLRGIVGREEELGIVDRALRGLVSGRGQILVFQGAPGVGKTALLDTVWDNLKANDSFFVTRVSGDLKEARRPYYLAARILVDLLNQRGNVGVELLNRIPAEDRRYLAHVLPGLVDEDVPSSIDHETREGIFVTFTRLLVETVGGRPLILLADDLEFADEATLRLLSEAAGSGELSFMLCGTAGESLRLSGETESSPVERFFEDCPEEMLVQREVLGPLGPLAVAEYLNRVFPNAKVPRGFEAELVKVTGGNPLFVSAIIRNLLEEGKVQLVGRDWVIEPLDAADLARTLESIVTEKISALAQEDREILERASTLGEEVPVSILTGSTALDESSVHAFLERAEALGLVSLDFQVNDEVMRFLGKAILDISYNAIDESRRQELHQDVGEYQERLFEQGLLPSAARLAYHFRRSTNDAKARRYEQIQRAYTDSVFDRREVSGYQRRTGPWDAVPTEIDELSQAAAQAGKDGPEEIEAGAPLDVEAVALVPEVLRMILSAMRNIQLYPPESMTITQAMEQTMAVLGRILARTGRLTLTYDEGALIANGEPLDLSENRMLETQMVDLLRGAALRAVSFARDVTVDEVRSLLLTMGTVVPGGIEPDFWRQASREGGFRSVEVRQTHYTRIDPSAGAVQPSRDDPALSAAETAEIPELIRDFIKTASDVRLYPVGSARVSAAIAALLHSLQSILKRRASLSLARVENLVLVNGERADVTEWESVADGFTSFLESNGLLSITFLPSVSGEDLHAFFGQLREQGGGQPEPGFWERFASERGMTGLALNKEAYAPEMIQALLASALTARAARSGSSPGAVAEGEDESAIVDLDDDSDVDSDVDTDLPVYPGSEVDVDVEGTPGAEDEEPGIEELGSELDVHPDVGEMPLTVGEGPEPALEDHLGGEVDADESLVQVTQKLMTKGEHEEVRDLLSRVFSEYERADVGHRTAKIRTCNRIFHELVIGLQHRFSELALDVLSEAVGTESEPSVLAEAAALLYEMAAAAIRFSDHRLAVQLYDVVQTRRSDLRAHGDAPGSPYAALLAVQLDDHTSQRLIEDLRSGRTEDQARASLVVRHLGVTAVELLIDVIKQERELRVRQLAAELLAELENGAGEKLKDTLLTEVLLEHRYRVLEVVDLVTQDLRMELAFNIGDENPKIRRAAFRLFERLRQDDLVDLMVPAACADDAALAKGAIRSLATVGTPAAVQAVVDLLQDTESPVHAGACCRALGSLKAEVGVEILGETLSRRTMTRNFYWDEEVRAVAAVALRQIGTPRAMAILEEHQGDASMRIREVARPKRAEP